MSYKIMQFNRGTGKAQGFVLVGEGEHQGTHVSMSSREMEDVVRTASERLRLETFDYEPRRPTLLLEKDPIDPRISGALAEHLDRRFLLAHADRIAANLPKVVTHKYTPEAQ